MCHEAMITNKMIMHQAPPSSGVFCLWDDV